MFISAPKQYLGAILQLVDYPRNPLIVKDSLGFTGGNALADPMENTGKPERLDASLGSHAG